MALPTPESLLQCTDFSTTVLPYLPQLYDLPQQLLQSYSSAQELKSLYIATNPLISALALSLFLAPIFLIVSEINGNYSQVDRMWSILPTIYNAHYTIYAHMTGLPTERLDTLLACSALWSLRLTFNYWRKGGYNIGSEDYRWEVLRHKISPALYFIFNVLFISLLQSLLLVFMTTPTYIFLLASKYGVPTSLTDTIFSRVLLGLVVVEYVADQQQWNFQTAKATYLKTAKVPFGFDQIDLDRGFVVNGLWSLSRHPNFAVEQAIWATLYQWACFTTGTIYNWTAIGAFSYLLLFQASTWFTELITAEKYQDYKEYQARVGKFLPKLFSSLPGDFSDQKAKPNVEVTQKQDKASARGTQKQK